MFPWMPVNITVLYKFSKGFTCFRKSLWTHQFYKDFTCNNKRLWTHQLYADFSKTLHVISGLYQSPADMLDSYCRHTHNCFRYLSCTVVYTVRHVIPGTLWFFCVIRVANETSVIDLGIVSWWRSAHGPAGGRGQGAGVPQDWDPTEFHYLGTRFRYPRIATWHYFFLLHAIGILVVVCNLISKVIFINLKLEN